MSQNNIKQTIDALLVERLQKYKTLNDETCLKMYQDIFLTIQEIIVEIPTIAKEITHDAVNFIAQAYYDMININGNEHLNPNIFTRRVFVTDLSTRDLLFCTMFLKETDIMAEIVATIKKRS